MSLDARFTPLRGGFVKMLPEGLFWGMWADNHKVAPETNISRGTQPVQKRYCLTQLSSSCLTHVPHSSPTYCIGSVWT